MQNLGLYAATKAAVDVVTKTAAKELGAKGIRVNAVAPGLIPTERVSTLSPEAEEGLKKQTPLGRHGTTAEVANTVAFLVGPQASWVNGQIIELAGGF
jgi:3-oxoacyl-[acyl-carrier protein] reductase